MQAKVMECDRQPMSFAVVRLLQFLKMSAIVFFVGIGAYSTVLAAVRNQWPDTRFTNYWCEPDTR